MKLKLVKPAEAYSPNFVDKRVRARIISTLEWALTTLGVTHPKHIHSGVLNKVLGQQQHPLGAWLRRKLLVARGGYLTTALAGAGAHAIPYTINEDGLFEVAACVGHPINRLQLLAQRYQEELETGDFTYIEKHHRLWHHLQQLKKTERDDFWAGHGYRHHYDIDACAPNIIIQKALRRGITPILIPTALSYLRDKQAFRERVAAHTGIDIGVAKNIINGLFFGARLIPHHKCGVFLALGSDEDILNTLKDMPEIQSLRREIKRAWANIEHGDGTPTPRWQVYFREERRVLDVIRTHCAARGIRVFCIHDGVVTDTPLDTNQLQNDIRQTGYILKV